MTSSSEEEVFSASSEELWEEELVVDENDKPNKAKNKPSAANSGKTLAAALTQVLERNESSSQANPTAILQSKTLKRLNEEEERQLDEKAKKLYKKEQKEKIRALRVKPMAETANAEKELKTLATAGVLQLFNSVYQAQQEKMTNVPNQKKQSKKGVEEGKVTNVNSDINFMDLIKSGPTKIQ